MELKRFVLIPISQFTNQLMLSKTKSKILYVSKLSIEAKRIFLADFGLSQKTAAAPASTATVEVSDSGGASCSKKARRRRIF